MGGISFFFAGNEGRDEAPTSEARVAGTAVRNNGAVGRDGSEFRPVFSPTTFPKGGEGIEIGMNNGW